MGVARTKFSVYLAKDLITALDVLAEIDRSKRATIMNRALAEYVERHKRVISAHRRKQQTSEAA